MAVSRVERRLCILRDGAMCNCVFTKIGWD